VKWMLRIASPHDAVSKSLPVRSLCPIAVDHNLCQIQPSRVYIQAATPEKSMAALVGKLPPRYWIEINERLVPFGKAVCIAARPKCPACPLLPMCRQVGVTDPR